MPPLDPPALIVVTGVSGSGKSVIGAMLAERLGLPFVDGDALHPPANIAKMAAAIPLDDADRAPWLDAIADRLAGWRDAGRGGIVACSALKRAYRDRLRGPGVRFVHLAEDARSVRARIARRGGHFMPVALVESQFAALEPPGPDEAAIVVHPAETPELRCARIVRALDDRQERSR